MSLSSAGEPESKKPRGNVWDEDFFSLWGPANSHCQRHHQRCGGVAVGPALRIACHWPPHSAGGPADMYRNARLRASGMRMAPAVLRPNRSSLCGRYGACGGREAAAKLLVCSSPPVCDRSHPAQTSSLQNFLNFWTSLEFLEGVGGWAPPTYAQPKKLWSTKRKWLALPGGPGHPPPPESPRGSQKVWVGGQYRDRILKRSLIQL